ncbi:MAG: hypothetical protein ACYS6K_29665 [Planctomycetota bacterium]|jgi:hypothetical protein
MNNPREDTGYIFTERRKRVRVTIADYGKAAKAEKAKQELREMLKQLQVETEKLEKYK